MVGKEATLAAPFALLLRSTTFVLGEGSAGQGVRDMQLPLRLDRSHPTPVHTWIAPLRPSVTLSTLS